MASADLEVFHCVSSERGLFSVTSVIVGTKSAIIIDPPFLISDAEAVIAFTREHTQHPVVAVFVTHHHPDHYFSASPILEAWPAARFYAHQYVLDGINREYADKVAFGPKVFGKNVPAQPRKPEVYPYSFFLLEGNEASTVCLLGPVQGDAVGHTLFWLPRERTLITGDAVFSRSCHAWVEEIETPAILHAWRLTLQLIETLAPTKIVTGHMEPGWELDAQKDLAHMHKYLDLFESKITQAPTKPTVDELFQTFKVAFPDCRKNVDFFLGKMANQFGEGGKVWEEERHRYAATRTRESLEGFLLGGASKSEHDGT